MASWHTDQLKYAFGIGGFMSFYGIVGLIVYMLPAETASMNQKIVIIALVLLTMPFAMIIGYVSTKRKAKKEKKEQEAIEGKAEEKSADAEKAPKLAPAAVNGDLAKSAEEVVQFLKTSNLGEAGKDAVYSLPWYIVAGTPKSGKSSLVLGSNLNFQNLPSQRESEQKFIRPTQNVDWRVTNDAVFVDTAGRFQTESGDANEWASLLETIKKYRGTRPIDGFLLVVSAEKILNSDEREIEETAKIMRARLDEVMLRVKLRFPVYLVFTNADSIEGFRDSFSTSKQEGKTLVWGATIPIEKSENGQTLFDGEFELLQNSIMKRRLMRLSAPFPPVRQLRIFNFPLHFGSTRRKLGAFVSTLFRPNPFSESPFLRGFYFTAAPVAKPRVNPGQTLPPNMPQTVGQTYFTERFFRDVVLRDKDLVKTFVEQKQKPPILGWVLTILGIILTLALLILAGLSLFNNKAMLAEASRKGDTVLKIVREDANINPLSKNADDTGKEIAAIDDLRKLLVKLDGYERDGAPIYMGFGLYTGNRMYKEKLLPIYFNAVERRYKDPMRKKVEDDLRAFAASPSVANPANLTEEEEKNLGKFYDLLKAYLMLSGDYKDKANQTDISNALKDYWIKESKVPENLQEAAKDQLDFWAKQVDRDEAPARFPRIQLDGNLITNVRKKLQAFPAPFRYYKRKVTEISKQVDEKFGATTVEAILSRNNADASFMEGNYAVPGAYTLEGYRLMKKAIGDAETTLSADDWVMGEMDKKQITGTNDDARKIEERYFRDYADQWRNFVKGARVKSYTKENAKDALQSFSSKSSPMLILSQEIARNTNFSSKAAAVGWIDWIKSFFSSAKESTDTGGNSPVEQEFRALFTFLGDGDPKGAPVEKYQVEVEKVSNKFAKFTPNEINQLSQELAQQNDKRFQELREARTKIDAALKPFNEKSSTQALADLLKQPVDNLNTLLGADAQSQVAKLWEKIALDAKETAKGFPFEDGQTEADLNKLKTFLNPVDGTLSKFFKENLEKEFECANKQCKPKEANKYNEAFVTYLNNAFRLRDTLFGTNANPSYAYTFEIKSIADALVEGVVDGEEVKAGETKNIKFPADAGKQVGVNLKVSSTSTPTSANTPAPTVSNSNTTNTTPVSKPTQSSNSSGFAITKQTTWGLFRFFNEGSPQPQSNAYALTYKTGGKTVTVVITPSGGDLFDKNIFKALRDVPQSILK
ncbi:MAG: type VI secretion system membrane subunit TssM [Pyrinomonadaceae bacterium]